MTSLPAMKRQGPRGYRHGGELRRVFASAIGCSAGVIRGCREAIGALSVAQSDAQVVADPIDSEHVRRGESVTAQDTVSSQIHTDACVRVFEGSGTLLVTTTCRPCSHEPKTAPASDPVTIWRASRHPPS